MLTERRDSWQLFAKMTFKCCTDGLKSHGTRILHFNFWIDSVEEAFARFTVPLDSAACSVCAFYWKQVVAKMHHAMKASRRSTQQRSGVNWKQFAFWSNMRQMWTRPQTAGEQLCMQQLKMAALTWFDSWLIKRQRRKRATMSVKHLSGWQLHMGTLKSFDSWLNREQIRTRAPMTVQHLSG